MATGGRQRPSVPAVSGRGGFTGRRLHAHGCRGTGGFAGRPPAGPGPGAFRLLVVALLLPLGMSLCARTLRPGPRRAAGGPSPTARSATVLAPAVGVVGGIYGIGGGSLTGPVLAGRGVPVATVAPAALAATFVTSIVGAGTYALLAVTTTGDIAPD